MMIPEYKKLDPFDRTNNMLHWLKQERKRELEKNCPDTIFHSVSVSGRLENTSSAGFSVN